MAQAKAKNAQILTTDRGGPLRLALGGVLLPVLGQWTVLVAAAEQAAVFVWMWIR